MFFITEEFGCQSEVLWKPYRQPAGSAVTLAALNIQNSVKISAVTAWMCVEWPDSYFTLWLFSIDLIIRSFCLWLTYSAETHSHSKVAVNHDTRTEQETVMNKCVLVSVWASEKLNSCYIWGKSTEEPLDDHFGNLKGIMWDLLCSAT